MTTKPAREPLTPQQFAGYIERRLADGSDPIEVLGRDGGELSLRVNGREMTIDLALFYTAYRQRPEQIEAVEHTLRQVLLGQSPDRQQQQYQQLATRIYPMLKPITLLVTIRERQLPMVAYRELLGDLIVTYVVDEGQSVSYLNEEHLEHWGISLVELHQQAIENLRRRTLQQVNFVATGADERRIFIFNSADGYDASRLLLTDILSRWAQEVPGALVIGVPNRDFLIGFSDADPDVLQGVAAQVQLDSQQQSYGLTDRLFTIDQGQIRLYEMD